MSAHFEFTPENRKVFETILQRYPRKRAALLPALHLAHQQLGHVSPEVEEYIAGLLELPVVDVHEVLTFYTLYFQKPMGRHHIRLCMSISCWIRKADAIKEHIENRLGVPDGEITPDGAISWEAVPDCLGACEYAPMLQLDGYYHHDLTAEKVDAIIDQLREG